jgi:hypothetical protein
MRSRKATSEKGTERRARELELVREFVEQLRSSQGWQRWLETRSRFRKYTLVILIAGCRPWPVGWADASVTCR